MHCDDKNALLETSITAILTIQKTLENNTYHIFMIKREAIDLKATSIADF